MLGCCGRGVRTAVRHMDTSLQLTLPVPTLLQGVGLATVAVSENVGTCCGGGAAPVEMYSDPLKPAAM